FAGRPAPPQYSLYRATYETVKDGIISRDKHINQDGEALLQFLYQHNNKPPRMIMHFYGYHEETVWITQTYKNNNGETVEERVPTTKRIEDFHFYIDCSADISPVCQGMYISPDPKTGEQKTLRQLCDEYTHSTNALKELKLTKEVSWDYNGLTYHKIVVKSDAAVSRWIDNKVLRFLNFITCLWIITLPIVWFCKKRFGHSHLKSSWCMNISERDWYGMHVQEVINSCRGRYAFNGR
ncbi:hypothetical protein BDF20DRAFT_805028, partial [Mycotypha africana]|uniref:uncharacterized protein n=1 Tax=Mycotypha africana TaxID=64632 RepID=UPI002301148B